MRMARSRKPHKCKKCRGLITSGTLYYPQQKGKAICFDCGKTPKSKTFIGWLLGWLK